MRKNKLKALAVFFVFTLLFAGSLSCGNKQESQENIEATAFAKVIDVGKNECILFRFPDGKILLVDCGGKGSFEKVKSTLDGLNINKIDYFVLTHPDLDHNGSAEQVINEYEVGCLYKPKIFGTLTNLFPDYKSAVSRAENLGVEIKISAIGEYFKGDGYAVAFLAPRAKGGAYADFNNSFDPTSTQVDDLSAVLYIDIYGIRFVLMGDAGYLVENQIVNDWESDFYFSTYKVLGVDVRLEDVEFIKLAKSGKDGCVGAEFISILKPKNVLLPIGDGLSPSDLVLSRIYNANPAYDLYRSDVYGNITINISGQNQYEILTDKK